MEKEVLESLLEEAQVDEDVEVSKVDDNYVTLSDGSHYVIYNEQGRNEAMQAYCLETFPFFQPTFLSNFTGLPTSLFENMDESLSREDAEKILTAVNSSIEEFAAKAADVDGYEHFLSDYEEELELIDNLYGYRIDG